MSAQRRPKTRKALGQHFLVDRDVLQRIVDVLPPGPEPVVEIGAGSGELTAALLESGRPVVALEIEPRLLRHLRKRFQASERLRLVQGDARELDMAELAAAPVYDVAGNLPYFAANPIIRRLLESPHPPRVAVVMVQLEVAQELAAEPPNLSLLSVATGVYAEADLLFTVPPEAFDPPPKVRSAVVRLVPRQRPLVPEHRMEPFFDLVSRTFRNPRKQIHNSLSRGLWMAPERATAALQAAGIDPRRRPETLAISEWLALLDACEATATE